MKSFYQDQYFHSCQSAYWHISYIHLKWKSQIKEPASLKLPHWPLTRKKFPYQELMMFSEQLPTYFQITFDKIQHHTYTTSVFHPPSMNFIPCISSAIITTITWKSYSPYLAANFHRANSTSAFQKTSNKKKIENKNCQKFQNYI